MGPKIKPFRRDSIHAGVTAKFSCITFFFVAPVAKCNLLSYVCVCMFSSRIQIENMSLFYWIPNLCTQSNFAMCLRLQLTLSIFDVIPLYIFFYSSLCVSFLFFYVILCGSPFSREINESLIEQKITSVGCMLQKTAWQKAHFHFWCRIEVNSMRSK